MGSLTFIILAILVTATIASPSFCRSNDCPRYTVVEQNNDFEVRAYETFRWASTTIINNHDLRAAQRAAFWKLFGYISGQNARGEKLKMTFPVRTKVVPGQAKDSFTVSFMIPFDVLTPPPPTASDIFLETNSPSTQFVRSFGGFANNEDWTRCISELKSALKTAGKPYTQGHYFTAGYDGPFVFFNRHNECWLQQWIIECWLKFWNSEYFHVDCNSK